MTNPDLGPTPRWATRTLRVLREHQQVVLLVLVMLVVRYLLADVRSYWYDEVLSVAVYGAWNPTVGAAIANLAENSVHPPAYQFILYNWMLVFGDGEVATRTLSNLYIAGATVLLYLAADLAWNRWVAFWTAAIFSGLYLPMYYAIETRSYAQSILIAALSTYAIIRVIQESRTRASLRELFRSRATALLAAAATLLLMTHYYNAFLWAAQGAFLLVYLAVLPDRRISVGRAMTYVVTVYAVSAGIMMMTWGAQTLHHFRNHADGYELEGVPRNPFDSLLSSTITPNLRGPGIMIVLLLLAGFTIVLWQVRVRPHRMNVDDPGATTGLIGYAVTSLVLPLPIAWIVFQVVGAERHSDRYFTYLTPSLALVLAISAYGLNLWARSWFPDRARPTVALITGVLSLAAMLVVVAPRTANIIVEQRYDWRVIVERTLDIIETDDDHRYIVYQSGFRQIPLMNFYFDQMSETTRVAGTIRRGEQGRSGPMVIEEAHDDIVAHDYLIVIFPHIPVTDYDEALTRLDAAYDLHLKQLDEDGLGLIVYRTGDG